MADNERRKSPSGPERSRPAHQIEMGKLRCMIWENHDQQQGTWYSITFSRLYKDGQGKQKTASSYGRDDLLPLAELSRQAFLWIHSPAPRAESASQLEEETQP